MVSMTVCMAAKAIRNQVETHFKYHFKYGPEPTAKGTLPAQDMIYVVDLVAAGLRIGGQVTHFGLLLSTSSPSHSFKNRCWRGVRFG